MSWRCAANVPLRGRCARRTCWCSSTTTCSRGRSICVGCCARWRATRRSSTSGSTVCRPAGCHPGHPQSRACCRVCRSRVAGACRRRSAPQHPQGLRRRAAELHRAAAAGRRIRRARGGGPGSPPMLLPLRLPNRARAALRPHPPPSAGASGAPPGAVERAPGTCPRGPAKGRAFHARRPSLVPLARTCGWSDCPHVTATCYYLRTVGPRHCPRPPSPDHPDSRPSPAPTLSRSSRSTATTTTAACESSWKSRCAARGRHRTPPLRAAVRPTAAAAVAPLRRRAPGRPASPASAVALARRRGRAGALPDAAQRRLRQPRLLGAQKVHRGEPCAAAGWKWPRPCLRTARHLQSLRSLERRVSNLEAAVASSARLYTDRRTPSARPRRGGGRTTSTPSARTCTGPPRRRTAAT